MTTYTQRGLHGRLVHDIGVRIVRGQLSPGDVIDTAATEEEHGVSRTVVREAIRVLAAKGLVDALPKRGTIVRAPTGWNLLDPDVLAWKFAEAPDVGTLRALHEVRLIFEPAGARLAAARADQTDLAAITAAMAAMREHHGDVEAVIVDDIRLHRAILAATHNLLMPAFESLIEAGLRARNRIMLARVSTPSYLDRHAAVVQAIADRDGDAAETAMRRLLEDAAADDERVLGGGSTVDGASAGQA